MSVPTPPLDCLRWGARIPVGLGHSTVLPEMDFETYSEAGYVWDDATQRWGGPPGAAKNAKGLPVVGAEPYAAHPTAETLWLAYDLKDGLGRRRWHPGLPAPLDLLGYLADGGLIEAHNVGFERWVWMHVCVARYGWPSVDDGQWRCSAAKARAAGWPGSLAPLGDALMLGTKKDKRGADLMKKFSMPRNPTKTDPRRRVLSMHTHPGHDGLKYKADRDRVDNDHADTQAYGDYNETDIATEAEASSRLPDLEGEELLWWQTHEAVNRRGVHIDRKGVENCIAIVEQTLLKYNSELLAMTGIDAASKVAQMLAWLHARGVHLDSLDEDSVTEALTWPDMDPECKRVLQIRAAAGSASVKKLFSIRNRLSSDDRLRDLYVYYGARTGRSTGEGPQPTNLAKAGPDTIRCGCTRHYGLHLIACPRCDMPKPPNARSVEWNPAVAEDALNVIATRSLPWVELVFGDALHTVSGCLRGLFNAAPGYDLISTDYNSIEAVGLAMMAGEQWRIDVFRTHGKIYEASAATAFRVPLEEILSAKERTGQHHPLRQKGKGLELACITPETQVLTNRGYVPILTLRCNDLLWDGLEWVTHSGVAWTGFRKVIALDGTRMTPDHLVLCGHSWQEARILASRASTLCQALETGSERLPYFSWKAKGTRFACELLATAVRPGIWLRRAIFDAGCPLGATNAQWSKPSGPLPSTEGSRTSSPTKKSASVSWVASALRSAVATTSPMQATAATADGAFLCPPSGALTSACFLSTLSLLTTGATQAWRWTESTWTALTRRATFASSRSQSTLATSEKLTTCKTGSKSWSNVFDVMNAGPRNRFTIKTNSGHLIVHNCGFQGWVGASKAFGIPGTDEEIKTDILAWRAASPAVEWFWGGQERRKATQVLLNATLPGYAGPVDDRLLDLADDSREAKWDRTPYLFGVEGMAVLALGTPNTWFEVTRLNGTASGVAYRYDTSIDVLYCRLPSDRLLQYHQPRLRPGDRGGQAISYWGWNSNPKNGPYGWIQMDIWGGRFVENIDQAICRDILRACCIELEQRGYPVVLHTYDEPVSEIPEGFGSVEEYERICTEVVIARCPWAHDWPIRAPGGYRAKRYRKG